MDDLHVSVKAETLWNVDLGPLGTLNITNSFITMILVMAALVLVGAWIVRRGSIDKPTRLQSGFELIVEFLLSIVEQAAGKRVGRSIWPLIGGLFIFIIFGNYAGLLPGVGTVGLWHNADGHDALYPFLRSPNADLNMTIAMALITFIVVQIAGVAAHGVGGRIKHMASPPFMFPIEVISELSRIVSLSFRLFGNIFAGEVLVTVMVTMSVVVLKNAFWVPVFMFGMPTIFLFLELLFGFIQALVFALLSLIYIALAAAGHEDHDEEHHPAPAAAPVGAGGD